MRKRLCFWIINIFAINQKHVEVDEDFCLKMKLLQSIPDQPYLQQVENTSAKPLTAALLESLRTLTKACKGTLTLTEDYI